MNKVFPPKILSVYCGFIFKLIIISLLFASCGDPEVIESKGEIKVPEGLKAVAGFDDVSISWKGLSGVSYVLYWSTDPEFDKSGGTPIIVDASSYEHESLERGKTYYYKILAKTAEGESDLSPSVSATPDGIIKVPEGLKAVAGYDNVSISWEGLSGVSYVLYWSTDPEFDKSSGTPIIVDASSYEHESLERGITYYYKILAKTADGESDLSPSVSAKPDRFTVNENKTVTDQLYGLMWEQMPDSTDHVAYSSGDVKSKCDSLETGSYDDWRTPNAFEIYTIIDENNTAPLINKEVFPNTKADKYYISDELPLQASTENLVIDFNKGDLDWYFDSNNYYVRCVRGEIINPGPSDNDRFIEVEVASDALKTFEDNLTGLVWAFSSENLTEEDIRNKCTQHNVGDRNFRVPTIVELTSIMDFERDDLSTLSAQRALRIFKKFSDIFGTSGYDVLITEYDPSNNSYSTNTKFLHLRDVIISTSDPDSDNLLVCVSSENSRFK